MEIVFRTNIDAYKSSHFPKDLKYVPRIGESVSVYPEFIGYFENKKFPLKLKVVDVTYYYNKVECELHYRDIDLQIAKATGVNLF